VNTKEIVATIDAEIARLQKARAVLGETVIDKPEGRPPGSAKAALRKRVISAAGRAKIAEAQRKRWAKSKQAAKKTTPKKQHATQP
jgi:hypothetical protein